MGGGSEGQDKPISEFGWDQFTGLYDRSKQKHLSKSECKLLEFEGKMPDELKGQPIYEGDIIEFKYRWFDDGIEDEVKLTVRGVVVYLEELMSFMLKGVRNKDWKRLFEKEDSLEYGEFLDIEWASEYFCVIGNIHENPELLLAG